MNHKILPSDARRKLIGELLHPIKLAQANPKQLELERLSDSELLIMRNLKVKNQPKLQTMCGA